MLEQFLDIDTGPAALDIPRSIREEFWRRGSGLYRGECCAAVKPPPDQARRLKQLPGKLYKDLRGWPFSWGQLVERRLYNLVIWEVVYDRLLRQLHWHKLGLPEIQRTALEWLACREPNFEPDRWKIVDLIGEFVVVPGCAYDAFAVACHFTCEAEGRQWMRQALEKGGAVHGVAAAVRERFLEGSS